MSTVARWESRSGKHYVNLVEIHLSDGSIGYDYTSRDSFGALGTMPLADAVAEVERRVALGYFQPDSLTTPMRRVR